MAEENTVNQDEMAKAMEEMAAGGAAGGSAETDMAAAMGENSTLSQDEIDSLLGFGAEEKIPTTGIDALLERSKDNYERFPMLEVIFDRFMRSATTSLRSFTGESVDISVENITSLRFEDYLNSIPLPALIGIFQAVEWENFGLVTIDSSLAYSMVDILLGGGKNKSTYRIDGRPFTTIEQDIVKSLTRVILDDLTTAFNPITSVTFRFDRLETNPRFASITRLSNPVVIISIRMECEGVGGKADIILPYVTLEPVKPLLTQMFAGESFGSDISWESYLTNELKNTFINISAMLNPKKITLKDLANLKVGSTLITNNKPDDDIMVTCNGIKLLSGLIGSAGENIAISITEPATRKELKNLIR
jgi:flagellar motor switch protein FliM